MSFGLVTFPVRLFAAARAEHVQFHMLHGKDLSRVKEVWYCAEENKPVDRSDLVKGYETGKGEYVVVEDEEVKKIAPPTATTMEIVQFVHQDEIDPIYFESSYYVGPEEAASKPYRLFVQALVETKYHAVAKLAMHGREHIVLLRPRGETMVLHTLYYANELHDANQSISKSTKLPAQEMQLAKTLIEHLASPFKPLAFHDTYRENVERLIQEKQRGHKISTVAKPKKAPVIDLMEALKRSLAATSEGQARAKAAKGGAKKPRRATAA